MSPPGSEGGGLQGSAEGEGQDPGSGQGAVVDGVEVDRGLLLALTSGQKRDPCGARTSSPGFSPEGGSGWGHGSALPVTAGGTVRRKAVRVAMATSSGLYLMEQLCPAVTMLGLRRVPSRYTWWSDMAL